MEVIATKAPIPILELKRKFTEDIHFEINYSEGLLKGKSFLTYLSNIKIPADLLLENEEDLMELTAVYLDLPVLYKQDSFVSIIVNLIMIRNDLPGSVPFDPDAFIAKYAEKLDRWEQRLDMLPLYGARCLLGDNLVIDEDTLGVEESVVGINWVHCIGHPALSLYLSREKPSRYSKYWFDEPVFAGKNLYHYFESVDNDVFTTASTIHLPQNKKDLFEIFDRFENILPELSKG